jgi:hypothetical protein
MAARSLSPKQILERMQRHRHAVRVLAHQSAQRAIKARLRAQGVRLTDVTAKDISIQARAWFDVHRDKLIAEAEQVIATSPRFAYLRINAQTEKPPISTTSTLQISGAK